MRRPLLYLLAVFILAAVLHGHSDECRGTGKERETRFLVLGDWGRGGGGVQRSVARRMGEYAARSSVSFVVTTGDNFYPRGVRDTADGHWRATFEDVYGASALQVPWHPVLGNHDYRGSTAAQVEYSGPGKRWRMPGRYYSFELEFSWGKALLVFLDTNVYIENYRRWDWRYPDLGAQDPEAQLAWLDGVLARSDARWKIAVGHHPVYSAGKKHGGSKELLRILEPLFDRHGVHLYLSGHEHNLQHLKPPGETHYVISGGGAGSRPAGKHLHALFARGTAGFAAVTIGEEALEIEFVDGGGNGIYRTAVGRVSPSSAD